MDKLKKVLLLSSNFIKNGWLFIGKNSSQLEVLVITIGLYFGIMQLVATNQNLELMKDGMKMTAEQTRIAREAYIKGKRFEEIKLIEEVGNRLYSGKNREIFEDLRKKDKTMANKYTEGQILDFLNELEYLHWLDINNDFGNDDIRTNFKWILETVCENQYISGPQGVVKQYGFSGIPSLCNKRR